MIKVFYTFTEELDKDQIFSICQLKNIRWKFGIKSHLVRFDTNVKKKDINVLLYQENNIIGYTLLRRRKLEIIKQANNQILKNDYKKEEEYYYFDTHITEPKVRKKGLSYPLMEEIIKVIKKYNSTSFLICDDDLVSYYLKFKWKLLNNEDFEVKDHKFSTNGMIFNDNISKENMDNKKNPKIQYKFYIHKTIF